MSVIGYLITCGRCEARMVVTAEAKHAKHCPDCLTQMLLEAIDQIDDSQPGPPQVHQPYDPPLLPWELELLGRADDDDYPIGEVQL